MMIFRYQYHQTILIQESDDEHEINDDLSQEYIPHENKRYFEPCNQHDLNDLTFVKRQESAQLLGSRLEESQMLSKDTIYSWYLSRDIEFRKYLLPMENLYIVTILLDW